jgi:poly-gamma-glutamate biosynthesis protein PgsC/CapC
MHDYLLSPEWVRFAFVFGIATSMVMYERRHLTTGSIVVPGYIAVFLIHPLVLIATFLNAFITFALVNKVLRRYVLLYGRTKFTVLAIVSTIIQATLLRVSPSGPWLWERDIPLFVGVGYIVPALIAHDMARQGIAKTVKSVMLAGTIVAIPIAVAIALDLPGVNDLAPVGGFGTLSFPVQWLPIAIVVSILASWAVSYNYGGRSGGFIGAAFVGMFMADPLQLVAAVLIAAAAYLVVTKLLMHRMILFGRRKFSAMLLTSSAIAWPALWLGNRMLSDELSRHLAVGSLALTPLLLPGLIANDVQRTSPRRVATGLAIASASAVTWTWWIGSTVTGQHLALGWKLAALGSAGVLGWPQLRALAERTADRVEARLATRPARPLPAITSLTAAMGLVRGVPSAGWSAMLAAADRVGDRIVRTAQAAIDAATSFAPSQQLALAGSGTTPQRVPVRNDHDTSSSDWHDWATWHPREAADALAWLDGTLAEITLRAEPATFLPGRRRTSEFDLATAGILSDALARPSALAPRIPTAMRRPLPDEAPAPVPSASPLPDLQPAGRAAMVSSDGGVFLPRIVDRTREPLTEPDAPDASEPVIERTVRELVAARMR